MLSNSPIRLVIADDYPIFRKGLIHSINLESNNSIQIVGEADNGERLIREVEKKKPGVVLTDIRMPLMCGVDASRIINKNFPGTSVIALTMFTEPQSIFEMFEAGAKGYLSKNSDTNEVIEAIKTVYAGEMHYCSGSSMNLIKKIGSSKYNQYKRNKDIHFTEREIQFIKLVCLELSIKEIADRMKISTRTVDEYCRNVKEKIEAKNSVGIALYALKNNIISADEF